MKKTVLIITALLTSLSLRAAEESSYSATVDVTYATSYVFRGVELANGTLMPSVEFGTGNFSAGIWGAQPLTDSIDNEIDFYAGFSVPMNDSWAFDAGATLYYYPELDTAGGTIDEATWEPYISVSGDVNGFAPAISAFYDITLEVLTLEGSLGYSVPLEGVASSLNFGAILGRVDPKSGPGYTYYNLGVSLPFAISATAMISVSLDYVHNDIFGAENDHFFGTIGMSIGF